MLVWLVCGVAGGMDAAVWEILATLVLGEAKGGPSLRRALGDWAGGQALGSTMVHHSFGILKIIYFEYIIRLFGMPVKVLFL